MIDIFMTTFHRKIFTQKTLELINERTEPGTYQLHIFDNGSDLDMQKYLTSLLYNGKIASLHLDSRNTGCLYNKGVFNSLADPNQKYYVVTDNDVFPPKLFPDWLSRMVAIMDAHPNLAFLVPQIPPQSFQMPDMSRIHDDVVYCGAVGNTFKMVRRNAFPANLIFDLGKFGDDSLVCDAVKARNYDVAFCRNIFAFHAGQCDNWGYDQEQIDQDPRKAGYGKPYTYSLWNEETFEPYSDNKI